MKKEVAKDLRFWAEKLPLIFEQEDVDIEMFGWELNLTPYGDSFKYNKTELYKVPFFQFRAVEHYQQLKDAFKVGGMVMAKQYMSEVIDKFESGKYQTSAQFV